jgi:hypothetical protein
MPKPFPAEFHRDVVAVAGKREAPIIQRMSRVLWDFGDGPTAVQAAA